MKRQRSISNPNPRRPGRLPYVYTPLSSPRHIRLIRLAHYDPLLSQAYITLTEHPIDAVANHFTALSYTWGSAIESFAQAPSPLSPLPNPSNIQLLILPGASFETFRRRDDLAAEGALLDTYTTDVRYLDTAGNLSDFFRSYLAGFPERHLRSRRNSFAQVAHLWIDAVCIDQDNPPEKATQIPLMGEIYSRAGRVLAWLGADESRLPVFEWWHGAVYPRLKSVLEDGGAEGLRKLREANFTNSGFWKEEFGMGVDEVPGGSWLEALAAYWAFYRSRRYFNRAWIVQEAVVARRFELVCGMKGSELNWEDLTGFASLLGNVGWLDSLDALAGELLADEYTSEMARGFGIMDIYGLQEHHREERYKDGGWATHWWAALSSVRRRDCFVKQDKVFATVGILQQALPPGTPIPFPVDASATPEEVYTNAASALLLYWPELTLLSFVELPLYRTFKNLPSWVPDLTTARFPWALGIFSSQFKAFPPLSSADPPPRTINRQTRHLRLRGFKLDTITTVTEYAPPLNIGLVHTALKFLASMPTTYPHMFKATTPGGEGGQRREAALVHTLTCHETSNLNRGNAEETGRLTVSFRDWLLVGLGQIFAGCLMQPEDADYSPTWVSECQQRVKEIEGIITSMPPRVLIPGVDELRAHAEAVVKAKKGKGEWPKCVVSPQEFKNQVGRVMLYRCLFQTREQWIGVCSEICKAGDEVWLLEGGAVPYVLRRMDEAEGGEKFQFFGECYVHGAMNGELMGEDVEGRLQEVVIM
ncbi:Heterokaryon incompatibility domain-containing protein [Madurella fahalii]|uniref:Heterokaryon incompatibility domain-containing protein n=1 Tax=Madurella fahalii TaxID=1157608 RepID=A0ABQ0GGV9_9PEZI